MDLLFSLSSLVCLAGDHPSEFGHRSSDCLCLRLLIDLVLAQLRVEIDGKLVACM